MIHHASRFLALAVAVSLISAMGNVSGQSAKKDLTGAEMVVGGMKSKASQRWKAGKAEKPELYRFILPKSGVDKEDAVLTVVPAGEKSDAEIVAGLKKLIQPPEGKSIDDVIKVQKVKIGTAEITYLEAKTKVGITDADSPGEKKEGYRIYGAAMKTPKDRYIITAVGPYNTMTFHKIDFKAWLGNFK